MRPFGVELFHESIELGLLLQQIRASGPCRFLLERQVHAFMPPGQESWDVACNALRDALGCA